MVRSRARRAERVRMIRHMWYHGELVLTPDADDCVRRDWRHAITKAYVVSPDLPERGLHGKPLGPRAQHRHTDVFETERGVCFRCWCCQTP